MINKETPKEAEKKVETAETTKTTTTAETPKKEDSSQEELEPAKSTTPAGMSLKLKQLK